MRVAVQLHQANKLAGDMRDYLHYLAEYTQLSNISNQYTAILRLHISHIWRLVFTFWARI